MSKYLVSINDLPPEGKKFEMEDQQIWLDPLREFKMDCRIEKPLKIDLSVIPADEGCLVRGRLTGTVVVPCNRCAENAQVELDGKFDEYEEIPPEKTAGSPVHGEAHIVYDRHAPMLDLGEIAWEQFMLALPSRPLCREDCKGLCPRCGANLNAGSCECETDNDDPRLAPLKNLKVTRQ